MTKYWLFAWASFLNLIEYRMNFVWSIVGTVISTLMLYMFWIAVLGSGFSSQYTTTSIGLYYLFITFVGTFAGFDPMRIANIIHDGVLGQELIKPYNFVLKEFFQTLPDKLLRLTILTLVYLLVLSLGARHHISIVQALFAWVAIVLAAISKFFIGLGIGGLGFWFKRIHGFNYLFWNFGGLFSGDLLPLDVLPAALLHLSIFLPFSYLAYFPVQILLGRINVGSQLLSGLVLQVIWALFFALVCKLIWHKGLVVFDATGA